MQSGQKTKIKSTMKSKLHLQSLAAIFFLIVSLGTAPAQKGPGSPPAVDPNTGLPLPQTRTLPAMDPVTGLPQPQPTPWKDPNWKDPDIVLPNVSFSEGLPISEVVRYLRRQFEGSFDILLPVNNDYDYNTTDIKLELKNVTASEVFYAMNLVFENDRTPLRWELMMNGHRPTAVLRIVPALLPSVPAPPPAPEPTRTVYFVGDLMGTEKSAGMTMDQIVKTVSEVWRMTYGEPGETIQFHKDAQLLIIKGTPDQIKFVEATLQAMRKKVELEQSQQKAAESRPKTEEPKSGGSSGNGAK